MEENEKDKFYIISFNYKNITLEERENFLKSGYKDILKKYFEKGIIKGYITVETCLRIELFLDVEGSLNIEYLKKIFKMEKIQIYKGMEAVEHLLKVICGFESIIKGEDQVLSQLRKAYLKSLEKGTVSTLLNIIFNQAIETGKKFRFESRINEKNLSLDSIAVKFIKLRFGSLKDRKIFVIGLGDLSRSILSLLYKTGSCSLTATNRSTRKAAEFEIDYRDVKRAAFNEKYEVIRESDIIVSATSAPHPILVKEKMNKILKDGKKRFFLDLAVPRDIDTGIEEYENVSLYHLEDIWKEYDKNIKKRDEIIEKYYYIIDEQTNKIGKKIEKRNRYISISP